MARANRPHATFLKDPQQLDLHQRRQFTDFVEEQGPAFGIDKKALVIADRPGEGAADVAEELGLEKALRQSAAVDRQEGTVGGGGEMRGSPAPEAPCRCRFRQ